MRAIQASFSSFSLVVMHAYSFRVHEPLPYVSNVLQLLDCTCVQGRPWISSTEQKSSLASPLSGSVAMPSRHLLLIAARWINPCWWKPAASELTFGLLLQGSEGNKRWLSYSVWGLVGVVLARYRGFG